MALSVSKNFIASYFRSDRVWMDHCDFVLLHDELCYCCLDGLKLSCELMSGVIFWCYVFTMTLKINNFFFEHLLVKISNKYPVNDFIWSIICKCPCCPGKKDLLSVSARFLCGGRRLLFFFFFFKLFFFLMKKGIYFKWPQLKQSECLVWMSCPICFVYDCVFIEQLKKQWILTF